MHLDERVEGNYRIYAGALEGPRGDGYVAAVVVDRLHGTERLRLREAWRDDRLACGHRWASPADAIGYAFDTASALIRSGSKALAC